MVPLLALRWSHLHLIALLGAAERPSEILASISALHDVPDTQNVPVQNSSGVSDLETAEHSAGQGAIHKEDDVTSERDNGQGQKASEAAKSRQLLQGVQHVLRSLKTSARINQMNLQRCRRMREAFLRRLRRSAPRMGNDTAPEMVSGKQHQHAKYELKQSTAGLDGLADIAYSVEDAKDDAVQKAKAVRSLVAVSLCST